MKRIAIISVEMLFFILAANSQQLLLAPTIEKTVAGNQYGSQLLFETKNQWSLGGFYQASLQNTGDGTQTVNPFYGVTVNAPIAKSGKMNFYFNVRGGVVNQYFIVVAPGIETKLKVSRYVSISFVTSVRMTYPSAGARISIKI